MKSIFSNVSIRNRFIAVFSIIALLFLINLLMTFGNLNKLRKISERLFNYHFTGMNSLVEADRDAYQSRLAISESFTVTKRNNTDLEKLSQEINENLDQIGSRYSKFYELYSAALTNKDDNLNDIVKANYEKIKSVSASIQDLLRQQNFEEAERVYYSEYVPAFEAMREMMNKFTDMFLNATDVEHGKTSISGKRIFISTFVVFLLVITLLVLSASSLTLSITKSLKKVIKASEDIAGGNLHVKIDTNEKNEIAQVLNSVEKMRDKLYNIVNSLISASTNISMASESLNLRSQKMAQGAAEQASSVEEISSAMEEMASNIQQNAENSKQTEIIAQNAAAGIKKGSSATVEAVGSMNNIAERISIINDIAFQTNILALNAAVEAARAGEHGRGFAVVAGEVRKLAERSKMAADEIQQLSNSVMNTSKDAGDQLGYLVPEIEKTAQLVQEITASSLEQNSGAEMINNTIQQLNLTTQQNTVLAEEVATSAEELSGQANYLKEITEYFKLS